MFLGIDIGSSSSKAVILNKNYDVIAAAVENIGTGTEGPSKVIQTVLMDAKLREKDIQYTVATGYGRIMYKKADKQITEITCHARGATFLKSGIRTIIDIGGQDAKIIRVNDKGNVENFVMNEKCAAGTGRFLEVMARILNCNINYLSDLAVQSRHRITISSTCTVFAESEVISQLASGAAKTDVALGAHYSVAKRVAGLAARIGIVPAVAMTGGVALNDSMVKTLSEEIHEPISVVPMPQQIGALGAAIYAADIYRQHK